MSEHVVTYTGKVIPLLSVSASDISLVDIAHSLSMQCRYNGHCKQFYSVAQHSVLVSMIIKPPQWKLWGLLHDAPEAYLGDLITPLKRHLLGLSSEYADIDARFNRAILEEFKVRTKLTEDEIRDHHPADWDRFRNLNVYSEIIKPADDVALVTEWDQLMVGDRSLIEPGREQYWEMLKAHDIVLQPMHPEAAKMVFLNRFKELTK